MSTTAQLSSQISELLAKWNAREAEFRDWLAGVPAGGPNGDGRYPLTDASGRTVLVDCPAKLQSAVEGPAGLSRQAQASAEAARDAALGHRDSAATDAAFANAAKNAAQQARSEAGVFRNEAAAHAAGLGSARLAAESAAETAALARDAAVAARDTAAGARDDTLVARSEAQVARDQAEAFAASINPAALATKAELQSELAALVGSTPEALNTLQEFAQALGNDPNFATTITGQLAGKAPLVHTHGIAEVSGLQTALDGKANVSHTHDWAAILNKPSTFAPSAHGHGIGDIAGLQAALDGKQPAGSYVTAAGFTWDNLAGKPSAFTPSAHRHGWADLDGPAPFLSLAGGTLSGFFSVSNGGDTTWDAHVELLQSHGTTSRPISLRFHQANRWWSRIEALGSEFRFKQGGSENLVDLRASTAHLSGLVVGGRNILAELDGKQPAGSYVTTAAFIWDNLGGKPAAFPPAVHRHRWADLDEVPAAFAPAPHTHGWGEITGKPATFTPSAHGHAIAEIDGLQAALDGKQPAGSYVTTAGFTWDNLGGKPAVSSDPSGGSIPLRTPEGFLAATYLHQSSANGENPAVSQVMVTNGSDGYLRKASVAHVAAAIAAAGARPTGLWLFDSNACGSVDGGQVPPLQAYASNGGPAMMAFHRSNLAAVNMGLDTDNVFRIGGWTWPGSRLTLDRNGNLEAAGEMRAAGGRVLRHASAGMAGGAVTISTAAPSGGQSGDIWLRV